MPHRRICSHRVVIDGQPLAPHADDTFHLWSMSYGEFLGYLGPEDSPIRRALATPARHAIAVPDASPPLVATAVPVGADDHLPGLALFFRLEPA